VAQNYGERTMAVDLKDRMVTKPSELLDIGHGITALKRERAPGTPALRTAGVGALGLGGNHLPPVWACR